MARITLTADYECLVGKEVDDSLIHAAIRKMNEEAAEKLGRQSGDPTIHVELLSLREAGWFSWRAILHFDSDIIREWDAEGVARRIEQVVQRFEISVEVPIARASTLALHEVTKPMREALQARKPLAASATIPLREGDNEATGEDPLPLVMGALRDVRPFSIDLHRQLDGMTAAVRGMELVISGGSVSAVGVAAAAFLSAQRPFAVPAVRHPYWAFATAVILGASFALSWLPLSVSGVALLCVAASGAAAVALLLARRNQIVGRTILGLVPVLILITFAVVYSIAGLSSPDLGLTGGEPLYMRDPLLLSLSLSTTVGLLDLAVGGWLRSVAYLEMLLVAGYLGTAGVLAVRSLSGRLNQTLRDLRSERQFG